jgi:uncharacterized protein
MLPIADSFAPETALLGGVAIGCATAVYALSFGRVAGISGHLKRTLLAATPADYLFPLGLLLGGFLSPSPSTPPLPLPAPTLFLAGALVSLGSALANGCTSGHAVCGLARLSPRSLAATGTFMLTAFVTSRAAGTAAALGPVPPMGADDLRAVVGALAVAWVALLVAMGVAGGSCRKSVTRAAAGGAMQVLVGVLFAGGLVVSRMAVPAKVAGFFEVGRKGFDPSLACVFPGALPIAGLAFWYLNEKRASPVLIVEVENISIPPSSWAIDIRLIGGAVIFGVGWALAGICPGPGVVLLGSALPFGPDSGTLPQIATWFSGYVTGVVTYEKVF